MGRARAICEEFCDTVLVGSTIQECEDYSSQEVEEIKCYLETKYFADLFERITQVRYCCTKANKEADLDKCIAWFEPQFLD